MSGLTKMKFSKNVKLASGGSSSRVIEELVDPGFLIYLPFVNQKTSGGGSIDLLMNTLSLFNLDRRVPLKSA